MKILRVIADGDYDASSFESKYDGEKVSDLIKRVEDGEVFMNDVDMDEGDEYEFNLDTYEVGKVDPKFLEFVRDCQDYDDSKHTNFYVENEVIRG